MWAHEKHLFLLKSKPFMQSNGLVLNVRIESAGTMDSSRNAKSQYPRHRSQENLDRFIPNREAMDMGYANAVLTERRTGKENSVERSASSVAYQKLLAETLNMNRRILTFKSKPPAPIEPIPRALLSPPNHKAKSRTRRHISQTADKILDAPDLSDDFYLNVLDWGRNNILAIALGSTVYLWDSSNSSTSELVTVSDDDGPVTSVSWAADGRHIALGLNNSCVELWDSISVKLLRRLRGHHERVGSLAWNKEILTTGSRDGNIINNDVRVRSHMVQTFLGHHQEVCGLKWSASGCQLASGGNDHLVFILDRSIASPNTHWLYRFQDHTAAVKALAWCPFQANLLASGGGVGDDTIKFWNAHMGSCLNSVNTGSQVCALQWNSHERELLSSHGFTENQLILWKYPSMVRLAELSGHTSRVLYMTQSPDGFTVASAGDDTLRLWNVFGIPEDAKPAPKESLMPFSPRYHFIR